MGIELSKIGRAGIAGWEGVRRVARGEYIKLISLVAKKMKRGQTPQEIAEDLIEEIRVIQPICDFINANPDCDTAAAYEYLADCLNRGTAGPL